MTSRASLGGDESLRLFCALVLPDGVRRRVAEWQRSLPASDARAVARDDLHVTLAFLGHRPAADAGPVAAALREAAAGAVASPVFRPLRYRETRSVGMLVLDDEDGRAGRLAAGLHAALEQLGVYRREARPWLPHLTVLRFPRPPRLRPALPDLPPFSPSGAAVYHSLLRRGGAQYQALELVPLGG